MLKLVKRGPVWHIRGTVAGENIRESTGCRTRSDAEQYVWQRQREIIERHTLGTAGTVTLAQAALDYMQAGGEARFLAPILNHFGEAFRLADLGNAEIDRAAAAIFPKAAPATVNRQLITPLRAIMTRAAEDGLVPFRKLRSRKGDRARTRWLRPEEAERLIDAASPHLARIVIALLGSGARVSELLSLEVNNAWPETGELWIEKTKNDHPRMVKLPERARDAVFGAEVPESGPLFRKPNGAPYAILARQSPIKTAFYGARDRAGLGDDVTPHVLRHTWATWYYSQTLDFGGLLDLGGWRSPDMAMRYRKAAPEALAGALLKTGWDFTKLGQALPPAPSQADRPAFRVVK